MIQTLRLYGQTLDDSSAGSRKIAFLPYKAGTNVFATSSDWTISAADFKITKAVTGSGLGAEASIATAPTWVNGRVVVILSGTELTCRYLTIRVENAAINSDEILVETYGNASAQYPTIFSGGGAGNPITSGTGTDQLSVSGGRAKADVAYWSGTAIGAVDTAGYPQVTIKNGTGSGEISTTAGAVNQVALVTTTTDVTNAVHADVRYWSGVAVTGLSFDATFAANMDSQGYTTTRAGYLDNINGTLATAASQTTIITHLTDIKGTGWVTGDNLHSRLDAAVSSRLAPTTAGNTLDVSATGEAGLDFSNVKDATVAHTLTNITVPAVTTVGSVTGAVGSVTGNVGGSVASVTGAVGSVTGNVGGNVTGTIGGLATQAKTDVENAVWNGLQSGHTTAGTFGKYLDAQVSTISGGSAPTAAEVADAVWDEVISGHLTAGSTGLKLNAAATAGDPWSTSIPGSYAAGTAGFILGETVNSNTAVITAGGFYVTSRVSNSNLVIWQGETWNHSEGTHETITRGTGETWPTDLTGYTITSTITKSAANTNTGTLSTLTMPCTVTQPTGNNQSFYIETGTSTASLPIGEGSRGYDWHVKAVKGTNEATLRAGVASVKKRL